MKKIMTVLMLIAVVLSFVSCETDEKSKTEASEKATGITAKQSDAKAAETPPVTEIAVSSTGAAQTSSTEPADGTVWKLSSDGTLTVYEDVVMNDIPGEQVPWASKKEKIKAVMIKSGVTSCGYNAFEGCRFLKSINVEEGNKTFASSDGILFDKEKTTLFCAPAGKDLADYVIPYGVVSVADSAFSSCRYLKGITIPDSVESIGSCAFSGCTALTSVAIPESVVKVGDWAFLNCASLKEITVPDSVESMGCGPVNGTLFFSDDANRENGVLYLGNHLINADYDVSGAVSIRQGTLTVAGTAFSGCGSVTEITVPDSVRYIGSNAFLGCASITEITIPAGVASIEGNVFRGCDSLTDIKVDEANVSFSSLDGVLFDKDRSALLIFPAGKGEIPYFAPEGVTSIADDAFAFCRVTGITLPSTVRTIGANAFYDCEVLAEITLSESVTSIGNGAFYNCCSLKKITIPDSVESIGDYVFSECDPDFVISCYEGSYAEQYAKDNDIGYFLYGPSVKNS